MENETENKEEGTLNDGATAIKIISATYGVIALFIGLVNTFWGNDPFFGLAIVLASFIYFLPVNAISKRLFGFSIPRIGLIKILLALFILWAALGVGELFDKIELMRNDL